MFKVLRKFNLQENEALLIFETDEMWTIKFPEDFFEMDPSLVTFLDKYPSVHVHKLSSEDLRISKVFHAQRLSGLIVAFVKANDQKIFLLQCLLGQNNLELVRHQVPPATAINGQVGDITAVRFWYVFDTVFVRY